MEWTGSTLCVLCIRPAGEMFSAAALAEMVSDCLSDDPVRVWLHKGDLIAPSESCDRMKQALLQGGCLLVPYPFVHVN